MLQAYSFPTLSEARERFGDSVDQGLDSELQKAFDEAVRRGYAEGLSQGRADAAIETQAAAAAARSEGYSAGREEGLVGVDALAAALREALVDLEGRRATLTVDAESFAVDLAIAVVERLVGTDKARLDFIKRATAAAVKALAPAMPTALFLNPSDAEHARAQLTDLPIRLDETMPTGAMRVDAGRFLVEGDLEEAFAQLRQTVFETKTRRRRSQT